MLPYFMTAPSPGIISSTMINAHYDSHDAYLDAIARERFDLPHAPRPPDDTPAPPRFLPEYDNLVLSHADRSRMFNALGPGGPFPQGRAIGALLVDGFYGANWKLTEGDGAATLTIDGFVPQPGDEADAVDEILAEGTGLLEFLAPGASERRVEFFPRV